MADPVELELFQTLRTLPEHKRGEFQIIYNSQRKDRNLALLLHCLMFLGLPGIGRMYVGDVVIGVLQLLGSWLTCGILALWPIVDLFFVMGAADNRNRTLIQRLALTTPGL